MTIPSSPEAPLTFATLVQQVRAAAPAGVLELDAGRIAADLGGAVGELLGGAVLRLEGLTVPAIDDRALRLSGTYRLPRVARRMRRDVSPAIAIEARFHDAGGAIGYTIAFAPLEHVLDAIAGDLAAVVERLPVTLDALWFTLSSVDVPAARFELPGRELAGVAVARGRGYFFRFESELLRRLRLEPTVFALIERAEPLQLTAVLDARLELPPFLEVKVARLAFEGAGAIVAQGRATLRVLGVELVVDGAVGVSLRGFDFSVPVERVLELPFVEPFFRGFSLKNPVAHFQGTIAQYTVGLTGDFVIDGSPNGGSFAVAYASGNPTPVPDLFELSATRVTLSDAFTVMTGARVTLPELLDGLVVLERVYLYHATVDGRKTASGVPSRRGARAHADVVVLGYRAYGEVEALPGGAARATLLLSPIELGGIIRISGTGGAAPATYAGARPKRDAFALSIDTSSRTATADLRVALLGAAAVACRGRLAPGALAFEIGLELPQPVGTLELRAELRHEAITLAAGFDCELSVDARIGGGRFKLAKLAAVHGELRIDAGPAQATAHVDVTARVGPLPVSFRLAVDPRQLDRIVEQLQRQLAKEVEAALVDAVAWVKAVLDGAIALANDLVVEKAADIGRALEQQFHATGREAAKVLKQAGCSAERAIEILAEGQQVAVEEWVATLKGAEAFAEREIVGALRKMSQMAEPKHMARQLGELLVANSVDPARVAEEVVDVLKAAADPVGDAADVLARVRVPAKEVARFLQRNRKTVNDAAKLIAIVYPLFVQQEVEDALRKADYAADQAVRAAANVFREAAAAVKRVQDELERAWRRYTPRISVTIGPIKF